MAAMIALGENEFYDSSCFLDAHVYHYLLALEI